MSASLSRRRFVGTAGVSAAGLASWALAGCGDDDDGAGSGAGTSASDKPAETLPTSSPPAVTASKGSVVISQSSLDTQPGDPHFLTSGVQEPIRYGQGVTAYYQRITGEVTPAVWDAMDFAADGMSYLIKVHPGIKFTNGMPLTAEDVKYSLDRMLQSPVSKSQWGTYIDKSELIDATNIKVSLKRVAPAWGFTMRGLYTIPKAYVATLNDGEWALEAFGKAPIGVGPYRLTENKVGSHISFEAHDGFFLGVPV